MGVLAAARSALVVAQTAPNTFLVHNFVSGLAGVADHQDPNLVNALPLPVWPTVVIDAIEAQVTFAGLVLPGVYRIDVVVPAGLASGDRLITALLGDAETPLDAFITVAAP